MLADEEGGGPVDQLADDQRPHHLRHRGRGFGRVASMADGISERKRFDESGSAKN